MKKHPTTDEFVDRLYGVNRPMEQSEHLDQCPECAERFEQFREQRARAARALPASQEFLAAQRRDIYARMGERPGVRLPWAPALAAAVCLLAVGVFSHRPSQAVKPVVAVAAADTQVFSDVYSMEQSVEPNAAKPIQALFEQDQ